MAEGGMAASLANVDERDGWTTHFADTMRGGQYLSGWRMAELHAKESPERAGDWRSGVPFLIGRPTEKFSSVTLVDISTRARTWVIGLALR